jgi:ribosomal protein S18 acetylase RimI-like enzyme
VDRLNSMIVDDFLRIEHEIVRDHGGLLRPRAGRRMRHSSYVIELRALTPGDWAIWRELRLAALAEAPHAFRSRLADWVGEGDSAGRWRARLSVPGSFNVVALFDGEPAGMASGVRAGDGVAELVSLWVSPAARCRGVGDQLMQAVERRARQEGMGTLRIAVVQGNSNAAALCRRNGFAPAGELGDPMPDGVPQNIMAKGLRRG